MNRTLLVRSTLRRLSRFKARSFFMGLGITVGVLATVVLLSLESRVKSRFLGFLADAYPADGIVLFSGSGPMGGAPRRYLSIEEIETVAARTGMKDWDPQVLVGFRDVRGPAGVARIAIAGGSERAPWVRRRGASAGRYFDAAEVSSRSKVALLGATAAERLMPWRLPVGERIFIDNLAFEVVGVLERRGADPHGRDLDDTIVVPYTTLQATLARSTAVAGAMFRVADRGRVEALSREVTRILREEHGVVEGQPDDFAVFTSASMQSFFRRAFRSFDLFGPLLSAALFLVSVLVVMTLQQLGVQSRRQEIGLRRAVGARERDVESQFVVETMFITVLAALSGLLLAEAAFPLLAPVLERSFGLVGAGGTPSARLIAGAAALATGLLGAIRPARRAARLDPIVALRTTGR